MFIACIASNETSSIEAKRLFVVPGYIPLLKKLIDLGYWDYKHSAPTGLKHYHLHVV
jgi:hypothetical protein